MLLHGGTGADSDWRYVFDEPLEGFRTIVPDLRGHGRSTNPSGKLTFRQVASDVLALMNRLGIERFKAIGMSLGAKTLLHVATAQPARVEAIVLVSATCASNSAMRRRAFLGVTSNNMQVVHHASRHFVQPHFWGRLSPAHASTHPNTLLLSINNVEHLSGWPSWRCSGPSRRINPVNGSQN